jgi:hypothetical protein
MLAVALRRSLLLILLLLAAARAWAGPSNPSFEVGLEGWRLEIGAHRANEGPVSQASVDHEVKKHGELSLRLHSDAQTLRWQMATQEFACRPGDRIVFLVAARCRKLRREANQYVNANSILIFYGPGRKRLGIVGGPVLRGDREWIDLFLHAIAPPKTVKVKAGFISTMSGTVWFDDVRIEITPTHPRDRRARAAGLEALRWHLERTYPHFGVRGVLGLGNANREDFVDAAQRMLAPLRDVHISVETPDGRNYVVVPNPHAPNWNDAAIRKRLTKTILDTPEHLVGRMGKIGYARIGTFAQAHGFDRVEKALDRLEDARALILDVRPNAGGDEKLAWRIAARFTDREIVYGKAQVRDPTLPGRTGFGPPFPRKLKGKRRDDRKVVVLQGPYCVSSTEWFVLMMCAAGKTTLGLPTRGSTGNPKPFKVFPDVAVLVPTWRGMTVDDEPIENVGVPPQIRVKGSHWTGDPTLEKALEILG